MGLSLGELIRQRLRPVLEARVTDKPAFYSRAPWSGVGPSDFSANHDKYLYDS